MEKQTLIVKVLEKWVHYLKTFYTLKLQWSFSKISSTQAKGLPCEPLRPWSPGGENLRECKGHCEEKVLTLGKHNSEKPDESFQEPRDSHHPLQRRGRHLACLCFKCRTCTSAFWERLGFCLAQQAIQLKHNLWLKSLCLCSCGLLSFMGIWL